MTAQFDGFDLTRDLEVVTRLFNDYRQRLYFMLLKAHPDTPAHVFDHAQQLLKSLDVEEIKQVKAFQDAYLSSP